MINALPNNSLNRVDLIAILSCHSADHTNSLVNAVRVKGAKVAIGFTGSVAGAEFWFDNVTDELLKGESINTAITIANRKTSNGFNDYPVATRTNSPSNINNQVVRGSNQTLPLDPLSDPV